MVLNRDVTTCCKCTGTRLWHSAHRLGAAQKLNSTSPSWFCIAEAQWQNNCLAEVTAKSLISRSLFQSGTELPKAFGRMFRMQVSKMRQFQIAFI